MREIPPVQSDLGDAKAIVESSNENGLLNPVHVASNGWEALDFLLSPKMFERRHCGQPVLILLGLGIQVIETPELLQIIKADLRTSMIPTVLLAPKLFDDEIYGAIRCRADGFLEKPLTFRKLLLMAEAVGVLRSHEQERQPAGDHGFS